MTLLDLSFASGETSLSVRRFAVKEAISALFEVTVTALSPRSDLGGASFVGRPAQLSASTALATRVWSGLCRAMELDEIEEGGLSTYTLTIVPDLWALTQRRGHRIFQHASIPEIAGRLLGEWQIEALWHVERSAYPKLEQRVQYGESDHAFLCRLLEEAGISFTFEDHLEKGTQLVFYDRPDAAPPRLPAPLRFVSRAEGARVSGMAYVTAVQVGEALRPGRATIRDFDFRRPQTALMAEALDGLPLEQAYEQFQYAPGAFLVEGAPPDPEGTPVADDQGVARSYETIGAALARRELRGERADKRTISFHTNALALAPGAVFAIDGHPRPEVSPAAPLLVASFAIEGEHDKEWRMRGEAVSAAHTYRPARVTPKPRIEGVQSATVVGPPAAAGPALPENAKSVEVHTDEFGRVRVQFPWNREGRFDRGVSCWVRVSQGWAGRGHGMFTIPRVGHEVLVDFFEGDPDQPVIVGRVWNGLSQLPYKLPEHKTVSTWKGRSTPERSGGNEIRLDDAQGRAHVYLQAEKHLRREVGRDEAHAVGRDRTRLVRRDARAAVQGNQTKVVLGDEIEAVGQRKRVRVGRDRHTVIAGEDTLHAGKWAAIQVVPGIAQDPAARAAKLEASAGILLHDERIALSTATATLLLDGPDILLVADVIECGSCTGGDGDYFDYLGNLFVASQAPLPPDPVQVIVKDPEGLPLGKLTLDRNRLSPSLTPSLRDFFRSGDPVEMYTDRTYDGAAVGAILQNLGPEAVISVGSRVPVRPPAPAPEPVTAPEASASGGGEQSGFARLDGSNFRGADQLDLGVVLVREPGRGVTRNVFVNRTLLPEQLKARFSDKVIELSAKDELIGQLESAPAYLGQSDAPDPNRRGADRPMFKRFPFRSGAEDHENDEAESEADWESEAREAAAEALDLAWARQGAPIVRTTPTASVQIITQSAEGGPLGGPFGNGGIRYYQTEGHFDDASRPLLFDGDNTLKGGGKHSPEDASVFLLGDVTGSLSLDAGNKNAAGQLASISTTDPLLRGGEGDFVTFGSGDPSQLDGRAFLPAGAAPTGPFWLLGSDDGGGRAGTRRRLVRFDAQGKFLAEVFYTRFMNVRSANGQSVKLGTPVVQPGVIGTLPIILSVASIALPIVGLGAAGLAAGLVSSTLTSKTPGNFVVNVLGQIVTSGLGPVGSGGAGLLGPQASQFYSIGRTLYNNDFKVDGNLLKSIAPTVVGLTTGNAVAAAAAGAGISVTDFARNPGLMTGLGVVSAGKGLSNAIGQSQARGARDASDAPTRFSFTDPATTAAIDKLFYRTGETTLGPDRKEWPGDPVGTQDPSAAQWWQPESLSFNFWQNEISKRPGTGLVAALAGIDKPLKPGETGKEPKTWVFNKSLSLGGKRFDEIVEKDLKGKSLGEDEYVEAGGYGIRLASDSEFNLPRLGYEFLLMLGGIVTGTAILVQDISAKIGEILQPYVRHGWVVVTTKGKEIVVRIREDAPLAFRQIMQDFQGKLNVLSRLTGGTMRLENFQAPPPASVGPRPKSPVPQKLTTSPADTKPKPPPSGGGGPPPEPKKNGPPPMAPPPDNKISSDVAPPATPAPPRTTPPASPPQETIYVGPLARELIGGLRPDPSGKVKVTEVGPASTPFGPITVYRTDNFTKIGRDAEGRIYTQFGNEWYPANLDPAVQSSLFRQFPNLAPLMPDSTVRVNQQLTLGSGGTATTIITSPNGVEMATDKTGTVFYVRTTARNGVPASQWIDPRGPLGRLGYSEAPFLVTGSSKLTTPSGITTFIHFDLRGVGPYRMNTTTGTLQKPDPSGNGWINVDKSGTTGGTSPSPVRLPSLPGGGTTGPGGIVPPNPIPITNEPLRQPTTPVRPKPSQPEMPVRDNIDPTQKPLEMPVERPLPATEPQPLPSYPERPLPPEPPKAPVTGDDPGDKNKPFIGAPAPSPVVPYKPPTIGVPVEPPAYFPTPEWMKIGDDPKVDRLLGIVGEVQQPTNDDDANDAKPVTVEVVPDEEASPATVAVDPDDEKPEMGPLEPSKYNPQGLDMNCNHCVLGWMTGMTAAQIEQLTGFPQLSANTKMLRQMARELGITLEPDIISTGTWDEAHVKAFQQMANTSADQFIVILRPTISESDTPEQLAQKLQLRGHTYGVERRAGELVPVDPQSGKEGWDDMQFPDVGKDVTVIVIPIGRKPQPTTPRRLP